MFIAIFNFVSSIFTAPVEHINTTVTSPEDEIEIIWLDCEEC